MTMDRVRQALRAPTDLPDNPALQALAYAILQFVCRVIAAFHIIIGIAIIVGGEARFPFPSYQPMLDLTNHAVWPLGVTAISSGLAMLFPHRLVMLVGLGVGFLWLNLFAAAFAVALFTYPNAGSTAPVPYWIIAVLHVALMTLRVAEYRDARRREVTQWTHRL